MNERRVTRGRIVSHVLCWALAAFGGAALGGCPRKEVVKTRPRNQPPPLVQVTGAGLLPYGLKLGMLRSEVEEQFLKQAVGRYTCRDEELRADFQHRRHDETSPFKKSRFLPTDRIPARFLGLPIESAKCLFSATGGLEGIELVVREHETLCGTLERVNLGRRQFIAARAALTRRFGRSPAIRRQRHTSWLTWSTRGVKLQLRKLYAGPGPSKDDKKALLRMGLKFGRVGPRRVSFPAHARPTPSPTKHPAPQRSPPKPLLGLVLGMTPAAARKALKHPGFTVSGCLPGKPCKELYCSVKSLLNAPAQVTLTFNSKGLHQWAINWSNLQVDYDEAYIYQQIQHRFANAQRLKPVLWYHGHIQCDVVGRVCNTVRWSRGNLEATLRTDRSAPGPCPNIGVSLTVKRVIKATVGHEKCPQMQSPP